MDEKILELLQEIKKDMDLNFSSIESRLNDIKKKQEILYKQSTEIDKEVTDNLDIINVKLNAIETRVIKINKRNMEQLEEIKIKLQ
ncbi:Uncharacterised protein [Clostridioides difficile]|nr:Uncharacterised protein [Clostridioides difficile]